MTALFPDTRPEAEAILIRLLRDAPVWRKVEMVGEMNQAVKIMMLSGLKERYPQETPEILPEDFNHDQVYGAVRVVNPFKE